MTTSAIWKTSTRRNSLKLSTSRYTSIKPPITKSSKTIVLQRFTNPLNMVLRTSTDNNAMSGALGLLCRKIREPEILVTSVADFEMGRSIRAPRHCRQYHRGHIETRAGFLGLGHAPLGN